MNIISTNNPAIIAEHIGSVVDVIAGTIPNELANCQFKASNFKYGFELASPDDILSMGESVIVNNTCFATSTNPKSANYLQTISGNQFVSSGLFIIPNSAKPTHLINQNLNVPLSLYDYYHKLFQSIKQPFAFAGFFKFSQLQTTTIAISPISNKNIFENKELYFPHPPQTEKDTYTFLVGAVANYKDESNSTLLNQLEVVLYNNPFDKTQNLTTHAHGITLNKIITNICEITPDIVNKTSHIITEKSFLNAIDVEIFAIESLKEYMESY
jgi:hypothetical protein